MAIAALPELFYFLINDFSIIVVLSPYSLLFSLLQTRDLDCYTFETVDLILDVFGKIIVFLLNRSFFLGLEVLDTIQSCSVSFEVILGGHVLIMHWR